MPPHIVRARAWNGGHILSLPDWPKVRIFADESESPEHRAQRFISLVLGVLVADVEVEVQYEGGERPTARSARAARANRSSGER
jgi:hypothetical protein